MEYEPSRSRQFCPPPATTPGRTEGDRQQTKPIATASSAPECRRTDSQMAADARLRLRRARDGLERQRIGERLARPLAASEPAVHNCTTDAPTVRKMTTYRTVTQSQPLICRGYLPAFWRVPHIANRTVGPCQCRTLPLNADLSTRQIAGERTLIALTFLLQPEVISAVAAY